MPTDTFDSFARRVEQFKDGISDAALKGVMTRLGVAAKGDALKAASGDLGGDNMFSGWAKAPLETRFEHVGPGRVSFHPTKRGAGPWTVAEFGRNTRAGPPGGKRMRRWNGVTRGKGTATKALATIEHETPKRLEDEVKKVIRKAFD